MSIDKNLIQRLKNQWRNCNASTIGFALAIPQKDWNSRAFDKRFKTFSWEFACLARTRMCYVKGLKTVCGIDGESVGLNRDGWRFFGYYHKGDSISDAWALAVIDEYPQNAPATAAYGKTMQEAIETLFDGRFSVERTTPRYGAVSVWVSDEGG